MIKRCALLMIALAAASGKTTLPPLSGLPELKTQLVVDFADHPTVGMPWRGRIGDSEFVFHDVQLKQIFRMPLPEGPLEKIGTQGQGPGEYQGVQDIYLEGDTVFVLDDRGWIIAFGPDGRVKKEMKPPLRLERFVGRQGDRFFLAGRSASQSAFRDRIIVSWQEGRSPDVLVSAAADVMTTRASSLDGQALAAGHFTLSEPAFALYEGKIVEASGRDYRLRFFDLAGRAAGIWEADAPEPEFVGSMFKSFNGQRSAYAVRAIFPVPSGLAVVGNFYRAGRPRLDCFDRQGRLRRSYLAPVAWEAPYSYFQIEHGCLVTFSTQEGCQIYRIISPL